MDFTKDLRFTVFTTGSGKTLYERSTRYKTNCGKSPHNHKYRVLAGRDKLLYMIQWRGVGASAQGAKQLL